MVGALALHADWVYALGILILAFIATTALRWKSGRRRRFRVTIVIERDYEGPGREEPDSPT